MDPANLNGVGERVAQVYSDAEVQLIVKIANALEKGLDAPDWAVRQLAEVNRLGSAARGLLLELGPEVAAEIEAAIAEAALLGIAEADADIRRMSGPRGVTPAAAVDVAAVEALASETVEAVTSTHEGILRSTTDGYRKVVSEVSGRTVTGVGNRREATQQALNKFADRGITGFTDRAGRNWRIDNYSEMAIRTATLRAMHTGHSNRLKQRGYDLVVVSSHPNPAPVCKEFEGKILSITGATPTGKRTFDSALNGDPVTEDVYATMDAAESKGLHHPNCRHRHTLFVPGVKRPAVDTPDSDEGYDNEQQLRKLERDVRHWKRRQAAAITPEAKRKAAAKVREKQGAIRSHVDETGVRRLRHREQLRNGDATKADDGAKLTRRPPPEPDTEPDTDDAPDTDPDAPDKPTRRKRKPKPVGPYDHLKTADDIEAATMQALNDEDYDALDALSVREDAMRDEDATRERRNAAARERRAAATAVKRQGQLDAYDAALADGMDDDEAVAKAFGKTVPQVRRENAISLLRGSGYQGRGFAEISRAAYHDNVYQQYQTAEAATNGYMLKRKYMNKAGSEDLDARLWRMTEDSARKYASDELLAHWDEVGRVTLDEFREQLVDPAQAARIRNERGDFNQ
jgi:hypothetical protein